MLCAEALEILTYRQLTDQFVLQYCIRPCSLSCFRDLDSALCNDSALSNWIEHVLGIDIGYPVSV